MKDSDGTDEDPSQDLIPTPFVPPPALSVPQTRERPKSTQSASQIPAAEPSTNEGGVQITNHPSANDLDQPQLPISPQVGVGLIQRLVDRGMPNAEVSAVIRMMASTSGTTSPGESSNAVPDASRSEAPPRYDFKAGEQ